MNGHRVVNTRCCLFRRLNNCSICRSIYTQTIRKVKSQKVERKSLLMMAAKFINQAVVVLMCEFVVFFSSSLPLLMIMMISYSLRCEGCLGYFNFREETKGTVEAFCKKRLFFPLVLLLGFTSRRAYLDEIHRYWDDNRGSKAENSRSTIIHPFA